MQTLLKISWRNLEDNVAYYKAKLKKNSRFKHLCSFSSVPLPILAISSLPPTQISSHDFWQLLQPSRHTLFGIHAPWEGRESRVQVTFSPLTYRMLINRKCYLLYMSKIKCGDYPGGTVVKNPPANAGDMGSSPGLGRSHMLWSN